MVIVNRPIREQSPPLHSMCKVAINGNDFVGIHLSGDDINITFPMGYAVPKHEKDLRQDIQALMGLFKTQHHQGTTLGQNAGSIINGEFPVQAYLTIIESFLSNGYQIESEPSYSVRQKGRPHWPKTVRKIRPFLQEVDGQHSFVYTEFVVNSAKLKTDALITIIHRQCVHESFEKLGWLYTTFQPEEPRSILNRNVALAIVRQAASNTFDDQKRRILNAMRDILSFQSSEANLRRFRFGTDTFWTLWEKMVDLAFRNLPPGKTTKDYHPQAHWIGIGDPMDLRPDTIHHDVENEVCYILDAKYYRHYGDIGASDIQKQITYAESIHKKYDIEEEKLFNAFLVPKKLSESDFPFAHKDSAHSDWRGNIQPYEHVQAVHIDTRWMLQNFNKMPNQYKENLKQIIKEKAEENVNGVRRVP
ncbi:MAG: LlaJI family restriction endonuclease [Candidatus Poseidoniales archaeon]